MSKEKLSPEMRVAVVLSVMTLIIAVSVSYASKQYTFLYVGLATFLTSIISTLIFQGTNKNAD